MQKEKTKSDWKIKCLRRNIYLKKLESNMKKNKIRNKIFFLKFLTKKMDILNLIKNFLELFKNQDGAFFTSKASID